MQSSYMIVYELFRSANVCENLYSPIHGRRETRHCNKIQSIERQRLYDISVKNVTVYNCY